MDFELSGDSPAQALLVLALLLVAGAAGGWLARRLRVPAITGNIAAGALVGTLLFRESDPTTALEPISAFAIGLISVSAGGHFSYRRIHNALRRILLIGVFEVVFAVGVVMGVMFALGAHWTVAILLGCMAAETAPATTLALIRECRAKGPFVKTLLAVVSVDSSVCILLFVFVQTLVGDYFSSGTGSFNLAASVAHMFAVLAGSAGIGIVLGIIATRVFVTPGFHDFSTMAVIILIAAGLSSVLGLSPLMACLALGVFLANSTAENERQLAALSPIEPIVYTAFFTLAGVSLHFGALAEAGWLCAGYLGARALGKGAGAVLGAQISGVSPRLKRTIPLAFVPQAGVALGLVVLLEADPRIPAEFSTLVVSLVLAAVTVNEIVGPFLTRAALTRAGEAGRDLPRLVEFLEEEFILTGLRAADKWDALRKLGEFYARTHRVRPDSMAHIMESVLERERDGTTAIGAGAAIPHGRADYGGGISGVLGICTEGIDFGAPDGEPVRLIALIVTPKEHEKRHLEVLGSLSAMISDPQIRTRLINAADANDAWEVIESRESRPYNYFLESDEAET